MEDLPSYSAEAQRAMKLLALTISKRGREFLQQYAPELDTEFPFKSHWSIAAVPVFFFYASCEARRAIDEIGATDAVLQIMRTHCPNALDFVARLDTSGDPSLFTDARLTELLEGLDFWPGDAIDYAKIRLKDKTRGGHWADTRLQPGSVSTVDLMFWVFHTGEPGDLVDAKSFTPFYHESEKLLPGLYEAFRLWHYYNRQAEDRKTLILEIRKRADTFRVNVLTPYGTFAQFRVQEEARASQLFIPCKQPVFLAHEVTELEQLINETGAQREQQLQEFLEKHSHFLRAVGFQGFHPQVHLIRQGIDNSDEKRANLRPDFIVEQLGLSPHAIVELKKAQAHMTAGPSDRRNYSAHLFSALRQLDDYWNFFQDSANRRWFAQVYGEEIANPELVLIIGNADIADVPLRSMVLTPTENRPVRLLTYSDILSFVRCQHLIVPEK